MGWGERSLLDFGKIVGGVLVEGHLSEATHGNFTVGPDFCQVEDVPAEFLGLFGREELHVTSPGGELSGFDLLKEILGGVVRVGTGEIASLFVGEVLDALVD